MGKQLFLGRQQPVPESFHPALNPSISDLIHKPAGNTGLWTSTYDPWNGGSAWARWRVAEEYGDVTKLEWWVLTPAPKARIFTINYYADLVGLLAQFERRTYAGMRGSIFAAIDFEAMARYYDAIHLTEAGEKATRYTQPGLYAWDCESTVWLRWAFESAAARVPVIEPQKTA